MEPHLAPTILSNEGKFTPVNRKKPVLIQSGLEFTGVEVPIISNTDEYEFLPGHFDVRYIVREVSDAASEPSYLVKLGSGEIETIRSSRLQTLSNGQEALSNFQNSYPIPKSPSSAATLSSDSNDDLSDSHSRSTRRARRGRNTKFTEFFGVISSDDEPSRAQSSSSDDAIVSSTTTSRRLRRRKRPRYTETLEGSDSDRSERIGTRYSTRHRKALRSNLRERYEDDISEHESASKEQKYLGAKETFQRVPLNDPFRLRHQDTCEVCSIRGDNSEKGPLVFCQGCTDVYHQNCLGPRTAREHLVTKVTDETFLLQCRRCLGMAHAKESASPHQGYCTICNEEGPMSEPLRQRLTSKEEQQLRQENGGKDPITSIDMDRVNDLDNLFFRCGSCHRAFHFEHLPDSDSTWQCEDCLSLPGEVGAMVAWRPISPNITGFVSEIPETDKDYLIKWKDQSYAHCTWMSGTWVWGFVNHHMRRAFLKSDKNQQPRMSLEEAVPEDFLRVDIIFDVKFSGNQDDYVRGQDIDADRDRLDDVTQAYVKFKGLPYEDSVWEAPPSRSNSECWGDFKSAYEDWVQQAYVHTPDPVPLRKHLQYIRKQKFKSQATQPDIMSGGEVMDYQQDGMNWLYYKWFKQQNAILADEMGLGKTIQVIGLLAILIQYHKCWPFLIVVPNSTCPNWRKEIKTWVPSMRVVTYYGSSLARKLAQSHEMFLENQLRCHVVVTSYETMVDDSSRRVLSKGPWAGLVVDEGQRLKSDKSQLYGALSKIKFPFKLLLTGTPLQNNTKELFNLIQFCDPTKNAESLELKYGTLSKENIPELHKLIRPFFLRRTKAQVLTFLPPVAQIIIPVTMSVVQKKLYKSILAKNPQLIKAIFQKKDEDQPLKQTERHNLNNILMQLRKCLCHPFIYSKAIEERTSDPTISHRNLVDAAGKLQLLELMLPKLQQRGHRVLIFSQFLENLDIMEDFLNGLGLRHLRLDGRMTSLEKQKTIDLYNAEDSPYFAFLLSTRSGGVGINLATADTVIIMDPDFNPHQDMQALSRAHRIGQKNKVLVFQLMVRGSAEEKIMQIGKKKMLLDHVLIDRMVSEENDGRDLESILRHGAQALFDDDNSADVTYNSESVHNLLDRSQIEQAESPTENDAGSGFSFARVWANENQNLGDHLQDSIEVSIPNANTWDKILRERESAAVEEARLRAEHLGRGKRKRTTIDYAVNTDPSPRKVRRDGESESDTDFSGDEAASDSDNSLGSVASDLTQPDKPTKVRSFKRVVADLNPVYDAPSLDSTLNENRQVCLACSLSHPVGYCRLKMAGVEHCGLCGLAHYGFSRTCPHLKSDTQVWRMLEALKESTEDREAVALARKYLRGIRGDLAQRQRRQSSKAAAAQAAHGTHGTSSASPGSAGGPSSASLPSASLPSPNLPPTKSPVIDLTRERTMGGNNQAQRSFKPTSQLYAGGDFRPPPSGSRFG